MIFATKERERAGAWGSPSGNLEYREGSCDLFFTQKFVHIDILFFLCVTIPQVQWRGEWGEKSPLLRLHPMNLLNKPRIFNRDTTILYVCIYIISKIFSGMHPTYALVHKW